MAYQGSKGSALFEMLADLAKNPNKLDDFKKDPDGVMKQYGLNEDQARLIKSGAEGNAHDYFKAIGDETVKHFSDQPTRGARDRRATVRFC